MLILLNDPAGATGVRRLQLDYGITLQANIERHLAAGGDCELRINGQRVDPMTDPRLDMPPAIGDVVAVAMRPAGFESWLYYLVVAAAAVYAYSVAGAAPPIDSTVGKESPNNRLTGQTNVARAYQAVPDVYGYRRVWPDLIQPSVVEYIDQVKYVTEWLCVSRGRGDVTDVRYADTPISEVEGGSYEVFQPPESGAGEYSEHYDTVLSDVLEAFATSGVDGQEISFDATPPNPTGWGNFSIVSGDTGLRLVTADGPQWAPLKAVIPYPAAVYITATHIDVHGGGDWSYYWAGGVLLDSYSVASGELTVDMTADSPVPAPPVTPAQADYTVVADGLTAPNIVGPFTLPIDDATQIRWNTVFLRGLKGTVRIKAEWWRIDGAGAEVSGTRQSQEFPFVADTFDQRFHTTTVTPGAGAGRYKVQFERMNAENSDGTDVAKLEGLFALRSYATKLLPGVTVIRVTTRATTAATGFSDRKFNLRWQRHVRTLATTAPSASRNFARAMVHVWALAGKDIGEIDTGALAAINAEFGEASPLLRFDGSLDDADMSLGERLQLIANHARCQVWRDGLRWTVTREQARELPEVQLDYRNLDTSGQSSIGYAAHLPASHDAIELEYVDPDTHASKAYVRLSVAAGTVAAGTGANPKKVQLPGCTNLTQAENRAQLEARRLLYERTTVSDTALGDAGQLGLGSLVRWVDPHDFSADADLQAGEVLAIAGSVIETSEAVDWQGQTSGRMVFTGADGAMIGSPVPCTPGADAVHVVLASAPAGLFVASASRQCGSRYAFAVGLSEAEIEAAGLYIVRNARPGSGGSVALTLANYDARLFGAD
ncbi:phage tail protein [Aquabacterium sp. OR-4]|uniref:phage tail protein n=1 Tax=Aquabacterium sp. OR-4 TaxID=2978127 RepID=UPI0021B1B608|nr:phage tail protein [Aquabacterium sp. OR-4]MDT7834951.1 phage tail protein [Aquabacterium sp. OR-4]